MRYALITLVMMLMAAPAIAQDVDLILPPTLASDSAPFYKEAKIKIGNDIMPVKEGTLPDGMLVQFQPENRAVIVSDASDVTDEAKGQALLDVVIGLQASNIETAAGQ